MSALARLFVVSAGYCLACLAGIATLVIAAPETGLFTLPPFTTVMEATLRAMTIAGLLLDAPIITIGAIGLASIVIAEIAELRSWVYHVLTWGAAAGVAAAASTWLWQPGAPDHISRDVVIAFVASGFVAGFVYWLVAGRSV